MAHALLPLDILKTIADQLSSDSLALSSLSLTCLDLRDWSRHRLFHSLYVKCPGDVDGLRELLTRDPHLKQSVRSVTLCPGDSVPDLLQTCAVDLLPRLPRLCGLELRRGPHTQQYAPLAFHPTIRRFLSQYLGERARDLRLGPITITCDRELLQVLRMFPQLKHLRCNQVEFARRSVVGDMQPRSQIHLTTLQVGMLHCVDICQISLTAKQVYGTDGILVQWLLHMTRSTLEELTTSIAPEFGVRGSTR